MGEPKITQGEVKYRNHIVAGPHWSGLGDLHKIVNFWHDPLSWAGRLEDCRVLARFIIPGPDGQPVGRLIVELQPAFQRSDKRPMYVLNLTARGRSGEGAEFLDEGRKWIVQAFDSLTTEQMHKAWGRSEQC